MRQLFERAVKPLRGGWKLRRESLRDFRADFVAAAPDRRAERGDHIARMRPKFHAHPAKGLYGDARKRAAPAGVDCRHRMTPCIREKNWHAVCSLHGEQQTWLSSDERVRFRRFRARRSGDVN